MGLFARILVLPPRRSRSWHRYVPARYFESMGARPSGGFGRTYITKEQKMAELFGGRRKCGSDDSWSLSPEDQPRAALGRDFAMLPPGDSPQRREMKAMIKDQIKSKIKNRLQKERQAFYDRQPKNEEERIELKIKRAYKIIGYKQLELRKYKMEEPPLSASIHDPEVLTAEQLHYLKKIGQKSKNYVPVGKRGVYGGTVENMHMHWKRHQTVRMDCHTFSMDEVKEISEELAKLSGGIVVDILPDKTIILYRGRNYEQPKKLIPPNTLTKRAALKKAVLEQSIAARLRYVDFLERNLKQLREQKEYEEKRKMQAIEYKDEAVRSVPVRKVKPYFKAVGDAYDFEDDSDPCSETESDEIDEDDEEGAILSGEEDQKYLYVEGEKQRKELKHIREFLLRHRMKKKRLESKLRKRREEYERFGWSNRAST
ncbi:uncharacterized CRM domain-containing protein At3g25440, chloroplastic-like [Selaginella moellendorffii]|uniref:uncharacterized CRM domain-containing protein At3g25440, chloroplastic-like n=1 Tax=Selaginella moellendorffii TaxID=88036 RepID=UPI000D1CC07A|nr:uncharacterized CRM domain-containing protein At3g25440, chloroplastic-like [Selaginella moellendorffii]|eukprot:XP_024526220.1 uncharacterized CRM domain-containing protein At3g25440, chloroplastic-like [Selaginella moellendorffii]